MPTITELRQLQALPFDLKVEKSKARIREWYYHFGGKVYVSFSGGKDSTVLLHIVRSIFPDTEAVFVNTGLEYPEIVEFVKTFDNVTMLKPKMDFVSVIKKYGFPVISKEVALAVEYAKTGSEWAINKFKGLESDGGEDIAGFKQSFIKYGYLVDAPFKVSSKCCNVMKKEPIKRYEKEYKKVPFTGMMAEESAMRMNSYTKNGCNSFDSKRPISNPLGFWIEQDIHTYIHTN